MEFRKMVTIDPICKKAKETQIERTDFWTLWEKARVGWLERIALRHVYYHMWNRRPVQVQCRALKAGALGQPRGMGWGEKCSGWGTHGGLHGQRSLMGCSPRGHKESDTTDQLYHSNSVELWNKESMCSFYSSFTSSQFRELSLKVWALHYFSASSQ